MSTEIRPSDSVPDTLLQIAGGALGLAGLLAVLVAVQFQLWWSVPTLETYALYAMLAGGITTMGLGWFVSDGRVWAVALGILVAPALALFSGVWAGWVLLNLSFTLFMFATPPVATIAAFLMPFALPSARRCSAAREAIGGQRFGLA